MPDHNAPAMRSLIILYLPRPIPPAAKSGTFFLKFTTNLTKILNIHLKDNIKHPDNRLSKDDKKNKISEN